MAVLILKNNTTTFTSGELIDENGELALLTEDEIHKLSLYLQSLK
jgi:hypothetical protein